MKIGQKVKYIGAANWAKGAAIYGCIVREYGPYNEIDENGTPFVSHRFAVKVDQRPRGWPYLDTDLFAPSIDEVKAV